MDKKLSSHSESKNAGQIKETEMFKKYGEMPWKRLLYRKLVYFYRRWRNYKKVEALEATEEQVREIYMEAARATALKGGNIKAGKVIKWGILLAVLLLGSIFIYNKNM